MAEPEERTRSAERNASLNCTIDASVFVSAARREEISYEISRAFLRQVCADELAVFYPALVLPECAAAIARPTGDEELAREIVPLIRNFPNLQLVALDDALAAQAAEVATTCHLRGADAVYVAVAHLVGGSLITWDREMHERGSAVVQVFTPTEWL